jgi:hypothetical protein
MTSKPTDQDSPVKSALLPSLTELTVNEELFAEIIRKQSRRAHIKEIVAQAEGLRVPSVLALPKDISTVTSDIAMDDELEVWRNDFFIQIVNESKKIAEQAIAEGWPDSLVTRGESLKKALKLVTAHPFKAGYQAAAQTLAAENEIWKLRMTSECSSLQHQLTEMNGHKLANFQLRISLMSASKQLCSSEDVSTLALKLKEAAVWKLTEPSLFDTYTVLTHRIGQLEARLAKILGASPLGLKTDQPKAYACHHFAETCGNCKELVEQWKKEQASEVKPTPSLLQPANNDQESKAEFESWWAFFKEVYPEWAYADSDTIRFQIWQAARVPPAA